MKIKLIINCILSITMVIFTGCSQDKDIIENNYDSRIEDLYLKLSKIVYQNSRSNNITDKNSNNVMAFFSNTNLKYLSSLSKEDFLSLKNSLEAQLGKERIDEIEKVSEENYIYIFNLMGGDEGLNRYLNFTYLYLNSNGGIDCLKKMIPAFLSEKQLEYYIGMALYVDKLARPILNTISKDRPLSRVNRDKESCKKEAEIRLALVGLNIGVDAFLDLMTDGAALELTPFEGTAVTADLLSIWIDYEICNGRWHY